MYTLYTLDNQFIGEEQYAPYNFTGIIVLEGIARRWLYEGKYHRLDGAAVEWHGGDKDYYVNDEYITEEHFKLLMDIMKLKGLR